MKNNQVIIKNCFKEKGQNFEDILKESINVYIKNSLLVDYTRYSNYNIIPD